MPRALLLSTLALTMLIAPVVEAAPKRATASAATPGWSWPGSRAEVAYLVKKTPESCCSPY